MLAGTHDDLFTGISIVHPAMLDVKDVDGLKVPLAMYPSKVCLPSSLIPTFRSYNITAPA
jgi:hypothetical protein